MSEWITQTEAAAILGCHVSNIPKLLRNGILTSRKATRRSLPSIDRGEVEALADRRSRESEMRACRPRRTYQRVNHRPDQDHEWLSTRQVAMLLGIGQAAVRARVRRGRLPSVANGGRYWVRRDHLELVEAARLASKTRRP